MEMEKALLILFLSFVSFVIFFSKELLDDDIESSKRLWFYSPLFGLNLFLILFFSLAITIINSFHEYIYLLISLSLIFLLNLEFAAKCSTIPFESTPAWFNSKNSWKNKHIIIKKLNIKNKVLRDFAFQIVTSFSDLEHFAQTLFYFTFIYFASAGNFLNFVIIYILSTFATNVAKKKFKML